MHKFILLYLFILSVGTCIAQPAGYKILNPGTEFKKELAKAAQTTKSISSDFTQEKNLSLLDEKVISTGIFRFKKENKVRMEYKKPFSYLLIINNDKVNIKDSQKSNSFSAGSNKLFSVINSIIIDCVKGTALDNKDFTNKIFEGSKSFLVELTPVKKELKQFFNSIEVYIDKNDYTVQKINLKEPSGDNTLITFTNKATNVILDDAEFIAK